MKRKKSASYQEYLIKSLKDPEEAIGYLNAALESGDIEVFLIAIHHVVQAVSEISKIAEKSIKIRTSF